MKDSNAEGGDHCNGSLRGHFVLPGGGAYYLQIPTLLRVVRANIPMRYPGQCSAGVYPTAFLIGARVTGDATRLWWLSKKKKKAPTDVSASLAQKNRNPRKRCGFLAW